MRALDPRAKRVGGRDRAGLLVAGLLVLGAALVAPPPVEASFPAAGPGIGDAGPGWTAWLGCWEPVEGAADAPMLCVRPTEDGAEILTVEEARITERRSMARDGTIRRVSEDGCEGTERTWLSKVGARIYRSSRLDCGGIRRSSTALRAMVSATEWVEVRSVEVEGRDAASVMRYRPAADARMEAAGLSEIAGGREGAVESARMAASGPPDVDDVVEAHGAVGTEVVEAWIAEQGEPLRRLRSRELLQLADAGVPARVIDVAVAVSYPDRFQVDREPYAGAVPGLDPYAALPMAWGRHSLWSYRPWGYRGYPAGYYDPYRYRHRYYGQPCVVVVRAASATDGGGGRVVAGRGYTRRPPGRATSGRTDRSVRDASAGPSGSSPGKATGRKAKPRGSGSSGSGSGSGTGSGSGSGSGSGGPSGG